MNPTQMELCASLLFQSPLGDALMQNYEELEVKKYEVRELDNKLALAEDERQQLEDRQSELLAKVARLTDQLSAQKNKKLPAEEKGVMADCIAGARELISGMDSSPPLADSLGQAASMAADLAAGPQWSFEQWLQGLPLAAIIADSVRGVLTLELGGEGAGRHALSNCSPMHALSNCSPRPVPMQHARASTHASMQAMHPTSKAPPS